MPILLREHEQVVVVQLEAPARVLLVLRLAPPAASAADMDGCVPACAGTLRSSAVSGSACVLGQVVPAFDASMRQSGPAPWSWGAGSA